MSGNGTTMAGLLEHRRLSVGSVRASQYDLHSGFVYAEGYWCSFFSTLLAASITLILTPYSLFVFFKKLEDDDTLRIQSRHFMVRPPPRAVSRLFIMGQGNSD